MSKSTRLAARLSACLSARLVVRLAAAAVTLAAAACAEDAPPSTSTSAAELTADQCMYFQDGGRTTICHATGSARNPIVQIKVATSACVNAHADHAGDFIAVNGNCGPDACLAADSPCDATLPCCDGFTCGASGRCEPVFRGCVSEDFSEYVQPTCGPQPDVLAVFDGHGTLRSFPLGVAETAVPGDESCEIVLGLCSTFNIDATSPVIVNRAAGGSFDLEFDVVLTTFDAPFLYSDSLSNRLDVTFYRAGAVVMTDVIDRSSTPCELGGPTTSWTVPGGFDEVRLTGTLVTVGAVTACTD